MGTWLIPAYVPFAGIDSLPLIGPQILFLFSSSPINWFPHRPPCQAAQRKDEELRTLVQAQEAAEAEALEQAALLEATIKAAEIKNLALVALEESQGALEQESAETAAALEESMLQAQEKEEELP